MILASGLTTGSSTSKMLDYMFCNEYCESYEVCKQNKIGNGLLPISNRALQFINDLERFKFRMSKEEHESQDNKLVEAIRILKNEIDKCREEQRKANKNKK